MKKDNQLHFDSIADKYEISALSWESIYQESRRILTPLISRKSVLDVGNGGKFIYDSSKAEKIIAMDISPKMLESLDQPNLVKVVDDAKTMSSIENSSVDVVVLGLVLHHINSEDVDATVNGFKKIIYNAHTKLREGGTLVIMEACPNRVLFWLQKLLFKLNRRFFSILDVPMVFFYSEQAIRKYLNQLFQPPYDDHIQVFDLEFSGWIDPLGGTLPGLIKIPGHLHPLKHKVFIVNFTE